MGARGTFGHSREVCPHGIPVSQCRCPAPDKAEKIIPCPMPDSHKGLAVIGGWTEDGTRPLQPGEGLKQRPGDQPLPVVNDRPDIQSQVIADITERRQVGISRYGTALQPFNGRDPLQDAYEEAIDLAMYLKQLIVERDG